MAEYIEREAAIAEMNAEGYTKNMRVHKRILAIHAADVAPVRRGWWDVYSAKDSLYTCSECHCLPRDRTPYCPNCGAKMDGEQ